MDQAMKGGSTNDNHRDGAIKTFLSLMAILLLAALVAICAFGAFSIGALNEKNTNRSIAVMDITDKRRVSLKELFLADSADIEKRNFSAVCLVTLSVFFIVETSFLVFYLRRRKK
jgi:hypothetical protein